MKSSIYWLRLASKNKLEYTIRVSPRARHVRLKVTAADGLCVVVPKGFNQSEVACLLAEKQAWIEKALLKVGGAPPALTLDYKPGELILPAIDERWQIVYQASGKRKRLSEDPLNRRLALSSAVHEQVAVFALLRRWLSLRARDVMVPQAQSLASELGFSIGRVTIRNQRGRWGSCSSRNNLSLNLKLLFVSPEQLRYVLVHELCHTVHMNHSPAFWQLFESFDPKFKVLKHSMHSAWRDVPAWV